MIEISQPALGQLTELESRCRALRAWAHRFAPVCGLLGAAVLACNFVARALGVDVTPAHIDVPAKIVELFTATELRNQGGQHFASVTETLFNSVSFIQPFLAVVALFGVALGLLGFVRSGQPSKVLGPIAAGAILLFAFPMMKTVVGGNFGPELSPREAFMQAVDKHRYQAVAADLEQVGQSDSPPGLYVLAQLALTEDAQDVKTKVVVNGELAGRIQAGRAGFAPSGAALYAIEHAAYGVATSPEAIAYEQDHVRRQGWVNAVGGFIAVLGIMGIAVTGTSMALGSLISRRVRRIHQLIGTTAA